MSQGSPLGPITLLPFARPPQASGGTGTWTARSAEGIYDKRHVLFEAASLIESQFFFSFKKKSLGSNTKKTKKRTSGE